MLAYHLRVRLESLKVEHLTVPYSKDILLENTEKMPETNTLAYFCDDEIFLLHQNLLVILFH
jgi:hypothetical protein